MQSIGGIKIINIILVGGIFLFNGCSNKKPLPTQIKRKDIHTKPYELMIKPIIGTRQDDTKVVMDMGKVMKIWIAPYKNGGTLVSSHDNYVVARAPDFVVGEAVPKKSWRSMKTPTNPIPFLFRNEDLDKSTQISKEGIVEFNNVINKQENDVRTAIKRLDMSNKYDERIKEFLNK